MAEGNESDDGEAGSSGGGGGTSTAASLEAVLDSIDFEMANSGEAAIAAAALHAITPETASVMVCSGAVGSDGSGLRTASGHPGAGSPLDTVSSLSRAIGRSFAFEGPNAGLVYSTPITHNWKTMEALFYKTDRAIAKSVGLTHEPAIPLGMDRSARVVTRSALAPCLNALTPAVP